MYVQFVHHNAYEMRITLNIDRELLQKAARLTGVAKKTALVRLGLEALIARASARRLARLGATEPRLKPVRRRRLAQWHDPGRHFRLSRSHPHRQPKAGGSSRWGSGPNAPICHRGTGVRCPAESC